jgi:hypothetical protein
VGISLKLVTNFGERLERVAERQDALRRSLEAAAAEYKERGQRVSERDRRWADVSEAIIRLEKTAEQRLTRLEDDHA